MAQLERTAGDSQPTITSLALVAGALGVLALTAPLVAAESPGARVGFLMACAAFLELLHGSRRATHAGRRRALVGGAITLLMALLLINAPLLAGAALLLFLAGWFVIDGVRYAISALRASDRRRRAQALLAGAGNLTVAVLVLTLGQRAINWTIAIAGALRIFGVAWNIIWSPVFTESDADDTVIDDLGFGDDPELAQIATEIEVEERNRAPIDRRWILAFIATLFAIHAGRMGTDGTLLGFVAPAVAVLGDMLIAVLVSLAILTPIALSWRKSTRWIERRVWKWHLQERYSGIFHRILDGWLRFRLRTAIRLRESRYSIPAALERGLANGLPIAAIIAATVPVWGMSWYFDTENWAAGMWNSWAESRTDEWREAMVQAVKRTGPADARLFAVDPPGIAGGGDFSFIVIGDPGEGDASQHVLRDQLLTVGARDDVRFVVVSSDVVYPTGSMRHYEANFWLPFKGITKPVYAIPGNHDWYDALEAFLATFLEPEAARASMRARAEADLRLTSTTDARIEMLIEQARRLRRAYGVPTGFQRAPFFEVQTDRFALLAIDTGIVRRVDPEQLEWLRSALERARGKLTMAILGHPFYAGGHDLTHDQEDFTSLKRLLLDAGVTIVTAGDTHDLEYYAEGSAAGGTVHHFVNGGGGAYLSFGTSLAWPAQVPTGEWAFYPSREVVNEKIETQTPWWKRPAWWWTRQLGAWPFSAEWLSAVFDYNNAPFFQSFVEVRVEPSSGRIRILPYGVHGPLRWSDLAKSDGLRPADVAEDAPVEWIIPMPKRGSGVGDRGSGL